MEKLSQFALLRKRRKTGFATGCRTAAPRCAGNGAGAARLWPPDPEDIENVKLRRGLEALHVEKVVAACDQLWCMQRATKNGKELRVAEEKTRLFQPIGDNATLRSLTAIDRVNPTMVLARLKGPADALRPRLAPCGQATEAGLPEEDLLLKELTPSGLGLGGVDTRIAAHLETNYGVWALNAAVERPSTRDGRSLPASGARLGRCCSEPGL